jgi:hypothetical protein
MIAVAKKTRTPASQKDHVTFVPIRVLQALSGSFPSPGPAGLGGALEYPLEVRR